MPFTEEVKLEAKRKAHYCCVWCQRREFFVEVHHITPESEGGESTLDNAAPLCSNCHTNIGHTPSARKQMLERRDWWWDFCAQQTRHFQPLPQLEQFQETAESLKATMEVEGQRRDAEFRELKRVVLDALQKQAEKVDSARTISELIVSSSSTSSPYLEEPPGVVTFDTCPECGAANVVLLPDPRGYGFCKECNNCGHQF
jgi:hypothetical protein